MIVETKYCDCCGKQIGYSQNTDNNTNGINGKAYLIPTWGTFCGDTMDLCNECCEKFANGFDEIWKRSSSIHKAILTYAGGREYV